MGPRLVLLHHKTWRCHPRHTQARTFTCRLIAQRMGDGLTPWCVWDVQLRTHRLVLSTDNLAAARCHSVPCQLTPRRKTHLCCRWHVCLLPYGAYRVLVRDSEAQWRRDTQTARAARQGTCWTVAACTRMTSISCSSRRSGWLASSSLQLVRNEFMANVRARASRCQWSGAAQRISLQCSIYDARWFDSATGARPSCQSLLSNSTHLARRGTCAAVVMLPACTTLCSGA